MVKVTETAAKEINRILVEQADKAEVQGESFILRVGVRGGGCSGYNYTLDITTADTKTEDDEEFTFYGIRVVVDPKSHIYLDGTEIDFRDELMGRGFIFIPPEGTTTQCGCGKSFSPI